MGAPVEESPKFERAAMKWLRRYLEAPPTPQKLSPRVSARARATTTRVMGPGELGELRHPLASSVAIAAAAYLGAAPGPTGP